MSIVVIANEKFIRWNSFIRLFHSDLSLTLIEMYTGEQINISLDLIYTPNWDLN